MTTAVFNMATNFMESGERRMGMTEVLSQQKAMHEKMENLGEKVEWLDEAIRGNGRPGINMRLELIEAHLARIDFWVGIAVKASLPMLGTIILAGLVAWIRSVT